MQFIVKLIRVNDTSGQDARDDLNANCTHVCENLWLFEGDEIALHEGIDFDIVGGRAIEGYGDLTGKEIKRMVHNLYNPDNCLHL